MAKQKIAVIEDDPAIAAMYEFKLQACGYHVETAADGERGLLLAERLRPDLILLDIMMPVMDGAEMLEKLRQTDWGANIHIVILTNLSKDEAPHSLRILSVDRYIVKAHYTPTQVADTVKEILGKPS